MKRYLLAVLFTSLTIILGGCSTIDKLNPFSDSSDKKAMKEQKIECATQKVESTSCKESKSQHAKCYAWDHNGMCVVW
jgi:hypothetical protein